MIQNRFTHRIPPLPKLGSLPLLLGLIGLLLTGGCGQAGKYQYQAIKQEQAAAAKPAPQPGGKQAPQTLPEVKLPARLDLRRAIGLALAHSPDQQMALARIRQSEALVDRAQAAFWPRLALSGSYQRGDAPSAYLFSTIDQRSLGNNVNFNQPGTFQNFEAGLGAGWNLYRGGRDVLSRRMAETGLEISRLDHQSVENALVASVIQAYYNALAARDFASIARDSQKTVGAQLKAMEVRHAAGGALKSDVLSLKVRLASAHESLVRANNNYRLSLAALANLMGADPDAEFTPVECRTPGMKIPPQYRAGLAVALELRPELHKARRQVERARMGLDSAKAGYLPTLDAQGRLYMDASTPDEFDTSKANWVAGLTLNWDLFTGFATSAEVRAASARLERMLAADRKATRQVQLEVRSSYLNLAEAKARRGVSRASVLSARESLTLVERQYDGGAATVTRYLEAELDLSRARQRAAAARYDQAKSEADLARSLGLWARYARSQEAADAP